MLGKVRVGFHISLTKVQLKNWGCRSDKAKQGQEMETTTTYLGVSKGALTKVIFNPSNYQYPLPMLQYVLSLPKTIWRNNVPLFK